MSGRVAWQKNVPIHQGRTSSVCVCACLCVYLSPTLLLQTQSECDTKSDVNVTTMIEKDGALAAHHSAIRRRRRRRRRRF